jgi:hypothetical protein
MWKTLFRDSASTRLFVLSPQFPMRSLKNELDAMSELYER